MHVYNCLLIIYNTYRLFINDIQKCIVEWLQVLFWAQKRAAVKGCSFSFWTFYRHLHFEISEDSLRGEIVPR